MGEKAKQRDASLSPEQKARIEEVRARARTPEARAREEAVRQHFADKPSRAEMIRRGDIDPSRAITQGALIALHKALAAVSRIREAKGLSLTDVAERAGLALPALSRLENGKNQNFTFETLSRYASGVGAELEIVVRERASEPATPDTLRVPLEELGVYLEALRNDIDAIATTTIQRIERLRDDVLKGRTVTPSEPAEGATPATQEQIRTTYGGRRFRAIS